MLSIECTTGPAVGPQGRGHVHAVQCGPGESPTLGQTELSPGIRLAWGLLSAAGVALGSYHGFKRNNSVGWALVWGSLGGFFPVITLPIAFAQGFAKPKQ